MYSREEKDILYYIRSYGYITLYILGYMALWPYLLVIYTYNDNRSLPKTLVVYLLDSI